MASSDRPPADIDPESLSRLAPLRREQLSETQEADYDALLHSVRDGRTLAGLNGPAGIWLRIPEIGAHMMAVASVVRTEIGLDLRLTELAILATAREMNSPFVWAMHEPVAIKQGLSADIIDIVKYRKPLPAMSETEAAIIELARETVGTKRVGAQTYAKAVNVFGETGVLQLAALIANYAMTAIMLAVIDQQLPSGRESGLPDLPDAKDESPR